MRFNPAEQMASTLDLDLKRTQALAYPETIRSKSQDPFIRHECNRPAPKADITGMCGFP